MEHVNGEMTVERWLMTQRRNTQKSVENEIGYLGVYTAVGLWVIVCAGLHWLVMY